MKNLKYKGYVGSIEMSGNKSDPTYYGSLLNVSDIICYHGWSLNELEESFKRSVDSYIILKK